MAPNQQFTKSQAIAPNVELDPDALQGRSVVLTGGASGIGEAVMRRFVSNGAFVTFGDLEDDRAQHLVHELGSNKVSFVHCDVRNWDDQLRLFKTALQRSPGHHIDIVVVNAGIGARDDIFHQEEQDEPSQPNLIVLETNLMAAAYTLKLALFYLPKQSEEPGRDRCIIMTASTSGYAGQPNSPQYTASKFGIRGLMHSIRMTGPSQNIRINLVAPWFVDTRIMPEEVKQRIRDHGVEFASVEDAATAYLHLASDSSINGRALAVLPRSFAPQGYMDLQKDDVDDKDKLLNALGKQIGPLIRAGGWS